MTRTTTSNIKKFVTATGRPMLYVPGNQLAFCDGFKFPVLIVWKRTRYADVTWLNEPFQRSHGDLWRQQDFQQDIEARAEDIFQRYAISNKSARAISPSFMTLYDLTIEDAKEEACDLFDMTLDIIKEYGNRPQNVDHREAP